MQGVFSDGDPQLFDCRPGYSFFFDFIKPECPSPNPAPLHRICSLMRKMGVECATREQLVTNDELAADLTAATVRVGGTAELKARRFTFFRRTPEGGRWQDLVDEDVLGY